jgi:hypothetical protein
MVHDQNDKKRPLNAHSILALQLVLKEILVEACDSLQIDMRLIPHRKQKFYDVEAALCICSMNSIVIGPKCPSFANKKLILFSGPKFSPYAKFTRGFNLKLNFKKCPGMQCPRTVKFTCCTTQY